jgi:DNA-binding transcriptional ArsR family regulator
MCERQHALIRLPGMGGNVSNQEFYCMHSDMCKTLANPKRQQILDTLRDREMTVSDLVEATGISQSNLSQHLGILRNRGVVSVRRQSAFAYYSITNLKIIEAFDLITEAMQESLQSQHQAASGNAASVND